MIHLFINRVHLFNIDPAGEFAEKYFKKGQMISVIGRLQVRSWDDNEGKKHWSTDVVVEEQYFAESKASFESHRDTTPAAHTGNQSAAAPKQESLAESDGFYPIDESIEDEDLPF